MEVKTLLTKRKIESLAELYHQSDTMQEGNFLKDKQIDEFVSHSSSDNKFIEKVNTFLYYSKGGIRPYVDWNDLSLPKEPNATTALKLKENGGIEIVPYAYTRKGELI